MVRPPLAPNARQRSGTGRLSRAGPGGRTEHAQQSLQLMMDQQHDEGEPPAEAWGRAAERGRGPRALGLPPEVTPRVREGHLALPPLDELSEDLG